MSEENVELCYRANDAFNRRDLDAWLALSDPEVEFNTLILELEGSPSYRGHDGVRSWWEKLLGVFPDFSSEIEELRDLGDVTVMRVRQRAHGIESDAPTEQTAWLVTEWRDKKAIWWRAVRSEAEALEAAGLRE
jgi:ketosteroid isomerase-like protein